jgi:formamidopyrimidine-DNA glycosylase
VSDTSRRLSGSARYGADVPELPEVETVRRRLAPALEGHRFEHVEITDPRLTRPLDPFEVARELEGERVTKVDRRGKYLIVRFESGRALLIHLRMTGSLLHAREGELRDDPHRRAVVKLDDGSDVAYRDVRRFGTWLLLEPSEVDTYVDARVGREPLEDAYKAKHLADRLENRRAPIKAAILDQRTVAGVGNIYADEALWRAKVHPLTPANELTPDEVKAVHKGIRASLQAGVRRQGSTLRDYRLPDGSSGTAQDRFKVYGRAGLPCERCGTPIDKIRAAVRGTWYCPSCQVYRASVVGSTEPERRRYAASSSSSRPSRSRRQSSV